MKQFQVHSLGGKIPSGDFLAEDKSEMDPSDEGEVESDVEMCDSDVVEPPLQKIGNLSEENRVAAHEPTIQAMEAIFLGKPHLTSATLLDPTSSIIHPTQVMKVLVNIENQQANLNNIPRFVGTINCAIGLGSGVLIGVDSWSTFDTEYCGFPYRRIVDDDFVKMERFPGDVVITTVGEATRNLKLIGHLERRHKHGFCSGVHDVIKETDSFLKHYPLTSTEEIEVLIAGYDNSQGACVLYHTGDGFILPGGSHFQVMHDTDTKCIGSGARGAEIVLQPRPNMTVGQGIDCMLRGLLGASFDDDATGGNFHIRLVSKDSSDLVAELNRIDAMLNLNFPPFKETSMLIFCKESSHPGFNVGGLRLNFFINSIVLKYTPVYLGIVDDRLGIYEDPWVLFIVDLNGAIDATGFLHLDPCTTFLRQCKSIPGHIKEYFCQCDFKVFDEENTNAMQTISKMVIMPGTFENLSLARKHGLLNCFDLAD